MKLWFIVFTASSLVALVTLVLPVGGLNYAALVTAHLSALAMMIKATGRNGNA